MNKKTPPAWFLEWKQKNAAKKAALEEELADLIRRRDAGESGLGWEIRVRELDIRDLEKALRVKWVGGNGGMRRIGAGGGEYLGAKSRNHPAGKRKFTGHRDTPDARKRPMQGGKVSPK